MGTIVGGDGPWLAMHACVPSQATDVVPLMLCYCTIVAPSITVSAPSGCVAGSACSISWSSTGSISNVRIWWCTSANGGCSSWVVQSTSNDGSYSWTPPNSAVGTRYLKAYDDSNTNVCDISPAVTIAAGEIPNQIQCVSEKSSGHTACE